MWRYLLWLLALAMFCWAGLLMIGAQASEARTGVCLLNCSTPVTIATPGAILCGAANGDWVQCVPPSTAATPNPGCALVANAFGTPGLTCGSVGSYFMTGHPEFSGSLLTGSYYFTESNVSSVENEVVKMAPVGGTFDNFCCHCDAAPGGTGRTFAFRSGTTIAGMADTALGVSFSSGQSGRRCDTVTDTAVLAAGSFLAVKTTNPSAGNDGRCACSARLRIP